VTPWNTPRFSRRSLAAAAAAGALAAAFPATADAAEPGRWSDCADGFASLPGLGRGPTTGGAGGEIVTATTQAELNAYVTAEAPYVIRVPGSIAIAPRGTELRVTSNKTIIGVGTRGEIVGGGFFLGPGVHNVIIRNLTIRDTLMPEDDPDDKEFDFDAIQMDTADHVWIDHNRLTRMNDGLIDSRKDTTFLTVSWNRLHENNKTFGIGWTPNVTAQMTVHHNWFKDTVQRNPSADNIANLHMYNNYMQDATAYGNYVRGLTKGVIENGYFERVHNPYYTVDGELVQRGSITVDCTWDEGLITSQGEAFDPRDFYDYRLDPARAVPGLVSRFSGPQRNIGT
jgi:pectate lyase